MPLNLEAYTSIIVDSIELLKRLILIPSMLLLTDVILNKSSLLHMQIVIYKIRIEIMACFPRIDVLFRLWNIYTNTIHS